MIIKNNLSKGREESELEIEWKLRIKDFGPISRGEITLKPLTVFIGPNNSGKSYAAMLIHSIFESYAPIPFPKRIPFFLGARLLIEDINIKALLREFSSLKKQISSLKEGEELEVPKQIVEKIINKIFEIIYEKRLSNEIIRSYASPIDELVRIGKKSFELGINVNSYDAHLIFRKNKLKIKRYPKSDVKIRIKACENPIIRVEEKKSEIFIKLGIRRKEGERTFLLLMYTILEAIAYRIHKKIAMPCYYLPAARSGILQAHKALAAGIVKKAPYAGIEKLEIPKFSGVVSDFISSIIELPERKGKFYQLTKNFEKELIKGEVIVQNLDEYTYPEIKYGFKGVKIPLHRSSSTVSELAPLFLYSKYLLRPRSILIIEEPEAHLHPENQRILAKFLVRLIRAGVKIIITTHSEYLLEQLSSFILLSKINQEKRVKKYKYGKTDFLKPDEISAYVFVYDKKTGGHKITEIKIREEEGIPQEEFIKIHEALYEETIKLQKDLLNSKR